MKAILLDLMDTAIPDPFFLQVPRMAGSLKQFYQLKNHEAYLKFESGEYAEEQYLANFFDSKVEAHEYPFTAAQFKDAILQTPPMYDHVSSFFKELAGRLPVYIASNYSEWISHHMANSGLAGHVAGVYASYQIGVRKPHEGFFLHILNDLGLSTDEVVFIDDQPANLDAARALGIRSYEAESDWPGQLLNEL